MFDEVTGLHVGHCLAYLLLRVHYDRAVPCNRLLDRLARHQQEADASIAGRRKPDSAKPWTRRRGRGPREALRYAIAATQAELSEFMIGLRGKVPASRITRKVQSLRVEIANTELA
jgi:hypothetical protein